MTRPDCPWYLSARAVTEFARILYLDPATIEGEIRTLLYGLRELESGKH